MATATLPKLPPSPDDRQASALAVWFIPWLLSTASHLGLILAMALLIEAPRGISDVDGPNDGINLTAVMLSDVGEEAAAAPEDESAEASAAVIAASAPQPQESAEPSPAAAAEAEPVEVHTEGELAAIEEEVDPVVLETVVPEVELAANLPRPLSGDEAVGASKLLRQVTEGNSPGNHNGQSTSHGGGAAGVAKALAAGAARTGVFGVSGVGYKFVYVFDRSGSMDGHGGAPLAAAKAELIHSLHELGKMHQFQIIFYNEAPRIFTLSGNDGRLTFATEQNRRLAERFVNGITADGATQHEDALTMALRMNPDVIFFLTDADEPALSARQLARLRRMNNGAIINTVEFGYGPRTSSENFLGWLARQNGGQHVYVDISELPRP